MPTRRIVAQSPGRWTNMDCLRTYPIETTQVEFIANTPEQVRTEKWSSSGGRGPRCHPILWSQSTSASPRSIPPPPAVTQGKSGGSKVSRPLGTKGPLVGTLFSFSQPVDMRTSEKRAMFSGGGIPDAFRGEEDHDIGVGGEEEEGLYKLYSAPE